MLTDLNDFLFMGSKARYTCDNGEGRTLTCGDGGWDPPNPPICSESSSNEMHYAICWVL